MWEGIATAIVVLCGGLLKLYYWRKDRNEKKDGKTNTAPDDPRHGEFSKWVRNHGKKD